ncbi:MAG TPA: type II toxin-antitoxin system RelE/ParE family toxin [Clostridia bacterium]|nr:type II toxin-antitoxin system RelE/ParE family toxin [Clostridia bacterium]
MKRWTVIVELPAQHDIEAAYLWIAERDAEAADRWFNSLYHTIGSLELFPERCPLAPESKFFNREVRQAFHGRRQNKYRILFTLTEAEVHILHVRHGARLTLGETAED